VFNLIIISDNPKVEFIERFLQTAVNVRIDVVADIDQALQDIFVKRPAVVCIQNRICDVQADEIARHIKMILHNNAPSFILLHEGDVGVKPVAGLFEYLLDLSLPETKLAETLGAALASILDIRYEHALRSLPPREEVQRETAGATSEPSRQSPDVGDTPFVLVNSLDEFITTMPEVRSMGDGDIPGPDNAPAAAPDRPEAPGAASRKEVPSRRVSAESGKPAGKAALQPLPPENTAAPSGTGAPAPAFSTNSPPPPRPKRPKPAPKPAVPATSGAPASRSFSITATPTPATRQETNGIASFIENFEPPQRKWRRRAGIALAIAAGIAAWYVLRKNPASPIPAPTAVHKAVSSAALPPANAAAPSPEAPSFCPAEGRDSAYALRNPGWERYAGTSYECRVFRENNRIKAVQVLSGNGQNLDEKLLKKVLSELAGNDRYRVVSREHANGYLIQRGDVDGKADLMLYNRGSKLHAFVVSLK